MNYEELTLHEKLIRELQTAALELQTGLRETKTESGERIAHILEMHVQDWQRELEFSISERKIAQRGQRAAELLESNVPKEETKQPEAEKPGGDEA